MTTPDAQTTPTVPPERPGRIARIALLLAGIILPQCLLYGPSLAGRKVLLPLDLLALQNYYLPWPADKPLPGRPSDWILVDLVMQEEVLRRFAVEQVRAGRVPLWNPYIYCGAPLVAANHTAVFSPYRALGYLWPGPRVLAWEQLLRAVVAGTGAYLFFRRELRAALVPALAGAWCFPLSGTMVQAVTWGHGATVTWLPWAMLAAGTAVRAPGALPGAAVMLTTALTQLSGHAATGAQVLLASAAYAAWSLVRRHGWRGPASRAYWKSAGTLGAGWALGVLLAAPQVLPTAEYLRTSDRIASRLQGEREAAPTGWTALAQFILPDFNGSTAPGSVYLIPESNRIESASGGYTGLLVTVVAAPLGLAAAATNRRRRGPCLFWLALACACMVPALGVPVLSRLFDLPPLAIMRNNRLVFVAGFAVLSLGVVGLDALVAAPENLLEAALRKWTRPMLAAAAFVGFLFLYLAINPPLQIEQRVPQDDVAHVQAWFRRAYLFGGALCAVAAAAWACLDTGRWRSRPVTFVATLGALALAEMVANAWGDNPQSDPSLYYPPVPALQELARRTPGRVWGVFCLPPDLAMVPGLQDVRGYDAVDPARPVRLVRMASDPASPESPPYARTQWAVPRTDSPLLDAMGVRYLVGRGKPPPLPNLLINESDYWVLERPSALPRAYVPRRAEVVNDEAERLRRLGSPDFAPADLAYLEWNESAATRPPTGPFDAAVRIQRDEPDLVRLEVDARTPAVVVLADHWYPGWVARLNGTPVSIVRANHAFRAVVVPAGRGVVEFRYEPASFRRGIWLATTAAGVHERGGVVVF